MSEKIKDILQMPEVPDDLKPGNIAEFIEKNRSPKNKIKLVISVVSAAAAVCLVFSAVLIHNRSKNNFNVLTVKETYTNGTSDRKTQNYFDGAYEEGAAEDYAEEVEGNGNVLSGISADAGFENAEVKELFDFGETLCKVVQGNTSEVYQTAVLAYLLPSSDELTDRIVLDGQFIKSERDGSKLSIVYISNDDSTEKKIVLNVGEGKLTEEKQD